MPSSTPSSTTRYRPAILVLTGAAAAYAAYLIYTTYQALDAIPTDKGLHRSNAIRRSNRRQRHRRLNTTRVLERLQQDAQPLGEVEFFGAAVELDASNIRSADELREIAQRAQPGVAPEHVELQIRQLYDTLLSRLLGTTFQGRALSAVEADAIIRWLSPQLPGGTLLPEVLQRHNSRYGAGDMGVIEHGDGDDDIDAESVAATELSIRSDDLDSHGDADSNGQTLQRTLYHIAEDRARQVGVVHRGITCNACDTKPIRGIRWRCANCADFDLCSDCEATDSHIKTHVFYKIRVPAPYLGVPKQEPIYPGRPHLMNPSINSMLKKRLVSDTKMEVEELEALWDQFTCLAGTEWESDPNKIGWALDRRAFNHAFIPRYSTFISAPNLIYDRIFAYYDSNHDGLIGFEEFVKGLDGMHSRKPEVKFEIVFKGYDVDGDGFISRKDVLRIFRAFYAIEKEATRNYLAENAEELSIRGALETIQSSQPLGSAFTQNSIPGHVPNLRQRLVKDAESNLGPVLSDDIDDTIDREIVIREHAPPTSRPYDALGERWARRQFYVDEEEGLNQPAGFEDETPAPGSEEHIDEEPPPTPDHERPRWSRSSSRVRFQDDVDFETRSNASTSSRPVGERWGGYEIPEPEKDVGKEVLYQITQQAFNELLDPVFQEKEDNAMDAFNTRAERRKVASELEKMAEEFEQEESCNKVVAHLGIYRYSKWLLKSIITKPASVKELLEELKHPETNLAGFKERFQRFLTAEEILLAEDARTLTNNRESDAMKLWNAKLCRLQFQNELIDTAIVLAKDLGWISAPQCSPLSSSPTTSVQALVHDHSYQAEEMLLNRDPTMPQFRPNSLADIQAHVVSEDDAQGESDENNSNTNYSFDHEDPYIQPGIHFFVTHKKANGTYLTWEDPTAPEPPPPPPPIPHPPDTLHSMTRSPETTSPPLPQSPSSPLLGSPLATDAPVLFALSIDPEALCLQYSECIPPSDLPWDEDRAYRALERDIRRNAMDKHSPLHSHFLASLEAADEEIRERKGSGLLSYKEFEKKMQEGKLRFMEAWLDWVSF